MSFTNRSAIQAHERIRLKAQQNHRQPSHDTMSTQPVHFNTPTLTSNQVIQLQKSMGNQAVLQLVNSAPVTTSPFTSATPQQSAALPIQRKLSVGPASDIYEKEAEHVAKQITTSPKASNQKFVGDRASHAQIQRVPAIGEAGGKVDTQFESQLQRGMNGGKSLPSSMRQKLEPHLRADLSNVKVHTDSNAVQLSREIGAKAFTHKNHIYYGAGQNPTDLKLTAHEVVHTVQQGAVPQTNLTPNLGSPAIQRDPLAETIQRQEEEEEDNDQDGSSSSSSGWVSSGHTSNNSLGGQIGDHRDMDPLANDYTPYQDEINKEIGLPKRAGYKAMARMARLGDWTMNRFRKQDQSPLYNSVRSKSQNTARKAQARLTNKYTSEGLSKRKRVEKEAKREEKSLRNQTKLKWNKLQGKKRGDEIDL